MVFNVVFAHNFILFWLVSRNSDEKVIIIDFTICYRPGPALVSYALISIRGETRVEEKLCIQRIRLCR